MTHPICQRLDAILDALDGALGNFQASLTAVTAQQDSLREGVVDLLRASFVGEISTEEATRLVQRMLEAGRRAQVIGDQMQRAMSKGGA